MKNKRRQTNGQFGLSFFVFFLIFSFVTLTLLFTYIYWGNPRYETKLTKPSLVRLIVAGDVMLGRSVEQESKKLRDFSYPFRKVGEKLRSADITFVNLENPIIDSCKPHTTGFIFCANKEMVEGLVFSGVDIVTLANNHTLNYGRNGLTQTKNYLTDNNIAYTGVGELTSIEKEGIRIGFIGFDKAQKGNPALTDEERRLIIESDKSVDILVVAPHWGVEYKKEPLPGVRSLAQELVRLGADVIVGSHPHWVQTIEYANSKGEISSTFGGDYVIPIYYSLGNFVFDQMWSEETKKGLSVELTFENGKLTKEERLPVFINTIGQPEFVQ